MARKPAKNYNFGNKRPWKEALQMELSRASNGPAGDALQRIARIVVHNALNGDLECIAEIANRMDGKVAPQSDQRAEERLEKLIVLWGGTQNGGAVKPSVPRGPAMIEHQPTRTQVDTGDVPEHG